MSGGARLLWLLVLLFSSLVTRQVRADAPPAGTILLVVDERAGALATRVAAELEALGFSVRSQTREPRPAELATEARRAGAFAAIGIGPTAQGTVEITVLDRVTGKTVRRVVGAIFDRSDHARVGRAARLGAVAGELDGDRSTASTAR
jgi:hypothetical protein